MAPRIAPLSPPYAPEVQASLDKWMPPGTGGPPLALFRTLARHELLSERMRPLGAALLGRTKLPMRVRELLILRTCARCSSEYEWGVHVTAFAAAAELDATTVAGTVRRSPQEVAAALTAEEVAAEVAPDDLVLRFVDDLHDTGGVADATWDALARHFDERALLEMIAVVGFYHLVSFVTNGARIEREPWAATFAAVAGSS